MLKNNNDNNDIYIKLSVSNSKEKKNTLGKNTSAFMKECKISYKLSRFLNIDETQLISRVAVTKIIHSYVKAHNLQNPDDGRIILYDDRLQELLNVPEGVTLSYFNLQRYLKPHFIKS